MKQKKILAVAVILAVIIILIFRKDRTVPDDLVGVWKTSIQEYAGSFFELKRGAIIFATKEGVLSTSNITKIKKKEQNQDWTIYTIYYKNQEKQKCEFPFYYYSVDKGTIRFKNKEQIVWRKEVS